MDLSKYKTLRETIDAQSQPGKVLAKLDLSAAVPAGTSPDAALLAVLQDAKTQFLAHPTLHGLKLAPGGDAGLILNVQQGTITISMPLIFVRPPQATPPQA